MEKSSPKGESMGQGIQQDIIEYDIVEATFTEALASKIQGRLEKGWSLYYAPFVIGTSVYQTVVKYGQAPYPVKPS